MLKLFALVVIVILSKAIGAAELRIESWRSDDLNVWKNDILPRFMAANPDIAVTFSPTAATEYDSALNARLEGGAAGDLITCRPFIRSLDLFKKGYLAPLNNLEGLENFDEFALSGWSTDDGSTVYCVPMASVIHGFMYNEDIFNELNLSPPETVNDFLDVLATVKEDGTYTAIAMGTHDQWEAATMGFNNIGPNYWQGEKGRKELITGDAQLSDAPYVEAMNSLARWREYMPKGFQAVTYSDSQNLFGYGLAAIYPTGSWEITGFASTANFKFNAFKPPVKNKGDACFITDHVDIGIGMNSKTKNVKAATKFLNWLTTAEFAELYSNALPGFFSLSNHSVNIENEVARSFANWRNVCESTIRLSDQILSRGIPSLSTQLWGATSKVINGTHGAEEVMRDLESELDSWYTPQ